MRRLPCLPALIVSSVCVLPLAAQVPPEKAVSTFSVAPGLEMTLWASEPLFVNPTCIDIDHKGRVWVCESVNYRDTLHHRPLKRPAGDRILILEDSKGTGKADKVTTFYQSPQLLAPLGIAVAKDPVGPGYKVYVCQSPDILVFEDKDGDGHADGPPRKLLSGFRGIDNDHGVHGISIGPDYKLYFSVGDQGVDGLVDKKGKRWTTNHTDCQGGTIWRCDLDGKNLELIAHNFRNEYEPCVDSFGTIFVSDNDDDGNQQTRICYVMPGGNYGYWPRGPQESHWHEEQPGVVPKILRTYFGSPAGMCVYEGTLLPEKYRGQLLHVDAGPRQVRCYHLTEDGAGYKVDREDMVNSTDTWFRPVDICVAPDGSVFVADWYDPGVGGHAMGDLSRGRIFRLAPKGNRPRVPAVDLQTKQGIYQALRCPALSVRYMAMAKLQTMGFKERSELLQDAVAQGVDRILTVRALWQLAMLYKQALAGFDEAASDANAQELRDLLMSLGIHLASPLIDPIEKWRVTGIRLTTACNSQSNPTKWEAKLQQHVVEDASAGVRREALLALRGTDPKAAQSLILALAKRYDGKDRFYLAAIGIAVGHDKARREAILADFDKQFPDWNEKVANLIWELRPPSVMPRLERQLQDESSPARQRVQIVDVLAGAPETAFGDILLRTLTTRLPAAVRDHIVQHLETALPAKWRDLRSSPALAHAIDELWSGTDTKPAALALIAASNKLDAIPRIQKVASDATQPAAVRRAAVQTLGRLPSREAVAALKSLTTANGDPLAIAAAQALGDQIPMWSQGPGTRPALQILEALTLDGHIDAELRRAAATTLAQTRPGAIWLLAGDTRNRLPGDVRPEIGRLLRNSPYQDLRDRAVQDFPPPARLDVKKLPSIAGLAQRRGDAHRGRELIAASVKGELQCLKCHTIHGSGGNVGPDLSAIGKKASRENLLESILLPSKAIADQYLTWNIETKNGVVISGLLVEDRADHITIRDVNAKDWKIDKKDIESRAKSPTSLMPNDLIAYLTEDDLLDIVEYLLTLKEEGRAAAR
jgi:putative membrane-bound dehydrogenase-like protein